MEITLLCGMLVAIAMLALRLRTDAPAQLAPPNGDTVAWARAATPVRARSETRPIFRIIGEPAPASPWPLLTMIDRACGPGHVPFALDREAALLERHAQAWADANWTETTWLTGHIGEARFDALRTELEDLRLARDVIVYAVAVPAVARPTVAD